jgi:hypothetical protein
MKTWIAMAALTLTLSLKAQAEKLDLETHNSLIQKLESALGVDNKDSMVLHGNVALRLADLYAERARLLAMQNEGRGDKIHKARIEADRRKSIQISRRVLTELDSSEQGKLLLQIAHLHGLLGEHAQSEKICRDITNSPSKYEGRTVALAHIQIADTAFYRSQLTESEKHLRKALSLRDNPRKGYARYRLAWVNFNQGEAQLAESQLIELLKNPELFENAKGEMDRAFQEDVSRDLATFMAFNDLKADSIETLMALTPEKTRRQNLMYLAQELDRTSKKRSSLKVWALLGDQGLSFEENLERQIQITRIEYDLGNQQALLTEIDKSLALLKDSRCQGSEECTVARQNLRRILTDWAKAQERAPTAELISGLAKFTSQIQDVELNYWAGIAATKRKQYVPAFDFYRQAAQILHSQGKTTSHKIFEGSLLGAIETAELSKSPELRIKAYQHYLSLNPRGARAPEVRYQVAHWYYEQNQFDKASAEFRTLALDSRMPRSLREKSADLGLDSNVLLKSDSLLELHSLEFAKALPHKSAEYLAIYRKAVLNQTAKVLNFQGSDDQIRTVQRQELAKLNSLKLKLWPAADRKQLVKNKIALSYRLKDLESLSQNSKELLLTKNITASDREMALSHLAWVAEVRMNFGEALSYWTMIRPAAGQKADYHFKMAILRDLNNSNPTADYRKVVQLSKSTEQRAFAAHQLVLNSKNPIAEFKKQERFLSSNASLMRSAGIFAYERTASTRFAETLMAKTAFRNSAYGTLISNQIKFKDFDQLQTQVRGIRLKAGSDSRLQRDLTKRIALLKKMEAKANAAIQKKDTSLQLIFLARLAQENAGLAREIRSLPAPRGLRGEALDQYRTQVAALIQPYEQQHQVILARNQELWAQALKADALTDLTEWSLQPSRPGSRIAAREVELLKGSAQSSGLPNDPFAKLTNDRRKVSQEAQTLKNRISKNPFNFEDLQKMKSLQMNLGSGPMVAYLDSRINELKAQGGPN